MGQFLVEVIPGDGRVGTEQVGVLEDLLERADPFDASGREPSVRAGEESEAALVLAVQVYHCATRGRSISCEQSRAMFVLAPLPPPGPHHVGHTRHLALHPVVALDELVHCVVLRIGTELAVEPGSHFGEVPQPVVRLIQLRS